MRLGNTGKCTNISEQSKQNTTQPSNNLDTTGQETISH
jgi:hypothetical protein